MATPTTSTISGTRVGYSCNMPWICRTVEGASSSKLATPCSCPFKPLSAIADPVTTSLMTIPSQGPQAHRESGAPPSPRLHWRTDEPSAPADLQPFGSGDRGHAGHRLVGDQGRTGIDEDGLGIDRGLCAVLGELGNRVHRP